MAPASVQTTMGLGLPGSPVAFPENPTLPPLARDIAFALAAFAQADAEPVAKRAARRHQTSERTVQRWAVEGPPAMRNAALFLSRAADAVRHAASLLTAACRSDLGRRSRAELVTLYHDVLAAEKAAEAIDTCGDLRRGGCWLERARATEADAALDLRKAAIERRFAELRLTDAEVWGGSR